MVFNSFSDNPRILNTAFKTFLQIAKIRQTPLSDLLTTMNPCNPRVCNAIVSATLIGRAWKVVKKVIKTSTLIDVMLDARFGQNTYVCGTGWGIPGFSEGKRFPQNVSQLREVYILGQATNVCLELCKGLTNQGRTLNVDNYYTSYTLSKMMIDKKTHLVGTWRANKKHMLKDVMDAKIKRSQIISREEQNGIVVLN